MGKLFKRGQTYYADLRSVGLGKFSLKTSSRKVAQKRLRNAELGETRPTVEPVPLRRALDWMLATKRGGTHESYSSKARTLCKVLGDATDIHQITREDVLSYVASRTKHVTEHTIHKELVALRQALKEAQKRGRFAGSLDVVPSWQARYTPKERALTQAEFDKLLAVTPQEHRLWIVLQVYTSANLGEMRRLGWDHVDVERGTIRIPGTKKTTRWRRVPIHPALKVWLQSADREKPLVTPWPGVNHKLYKLCDAAGIDRLSTNDLRRTFAAWLKQAGVDSLPVAHMMGHSSTYMVERVYGRLSEDTYRDAVEHLPVPNMSHQ